MPPHEAAHYLGPNNLVFPKWVTEKIYYGIEIGQTFLIYLGMWDEGEG